MASIAVGAGGSEREIVTVFGTLIRALCTNEGTGNNSTNRVVTLKDLSCNSAIFIKCLGGHKLLVSRNLKYAVSRGVNDKVATLHVLLSVVADNVCTRVGLVADNASANSTGKLVENLLGESVRVGGHRLLGDNTHHLPVTCGGVLATALFLKATNRCLVRPGGRKVVDNL